MNFEANAMSAPQTVRNTDDSSKHFCMTDSVEGRAADCIIWQNVFVTRCLMIGALVAYCTFDATIAHSRLLQQQASSLSTEHFNGSQPVQANSEKITVNGVRISMGDGVECPRIRSDDGSETPVSYLAPSIAIGDRVEVTGFMAVITTCRGQVLYVEEVRSTSL